MGELGGYQKEREEAGESNKKRKRRGQRDKSHRDRQDERIMRRQAGSEKTEQKNGVMGGDGARFVCEGPGGKAK